MLPPTTPVLNAHGEPVGGIGWTADFVLAAPLALSTVADAWRFQRALEQQLQKSGVRRVFVDARNAALSSPEVNEAMWGWVTSSGSFDRMAILNQSSVLTIAAKMKAIALGTKKVGVFTSLAEATAWLSR